MVNVSVARRYARALLSVISETGSADELVAQLATFSSVIEGHAELREVFVNPAYSRAERDAIADEILKQMGNVQPVLVNLIHLLIERRRIADLTNISRLFREIVDAKAGRVRGRITTAVPVGEEALRRLEHTLELVTQHDVILEERVDPSVLGGAAAQVGSILYDGTLRNELEEIRRNLKRS